MPSSAASAERVSASPSSPPWRRASSAGSSASIIVLSPGSALPRDCTPLTPASTAAVQVQLGLARGRRAHLQEQRAVERPGGPADARDQRHPDRLEVGADVAAVGAVELLDGLLHAAVHVGAV